MRPSLVVPPDAGELFLTSLGDEFSPHRLTQLVREYVIAADTGKQIYTQVSIRRLKAVHAVTHPASRAATEEDRSE